MDGETGKGERLTALQLKEMESRMMRHEILSLRCIAMKNGKQALRYSVLSISIPILKHLPTKSSRVEGAEGKRRI
jgi:hypothetical protein